MCKQVGGFDSRMIRQGVGSPPGSRASAQTAVGGQVPNLRGCGDQKSRFAICMLFELIETTPRNRSEREEESSFCFGAFASSVDV